jgi:hypothetical protein
VVLGPGPEIHELIQRNVESNQLIILKRQRKTGAPDRNNAALPKIQGIDVNPPAV